jgi:transposase
MMLTEGQMSDHKGARLMFNALPKAKTLIADKGYDSSAFRDALKERGTEPCIPPRRRRVHRPATERRCPRLVESQAISACPSCR